MYFLFSNKPAYGLVLLGQCYVVYWHSDDQDLFINPSGTKPGYYLETMSIPGDARSQAIGSHCIDYVE